GETAVRLQAQRSGLDGLHSPALGAPDQRLQPRGELAHAEGFDQIVIGTALQAGEPVLDGIPARQDQYRKLGLETSHSDHQLQAFEVREAEVEEQCLKGVLELGRLRSSSGIYM